MGIYILPMALDCVCVEKKLEGQDGNVEGMGRVGKGDGELCMSGREGASTCESIRIRLRKRIPMQNRVNYWSISN